MPISEMIFTDAPEARALIHSPRGTYRKNTATSSSATATITNQSTMKSMKSPPLSAVSLEPRER